MILNSTQPLANIWVAFRMGKNFRFYHINAICGSLGEPQSRALPVFHGFSGCDTTAFNGKGKKSVWQAWQVYEDVTETFVAVAGHPIQLQTRQCATVLLLCQREKKGTLLSEESRNGQTASHQRCATPACPTCSVSSRNLDDQHTDTTSGSFSTGFCLDQSFRLVGTSLGDNS